jgi:hypothetical protein
MSSKFGLSHYGTWCWEYFPLTEMKLQAARELRSSIIYTPHQIQCYEDNQIKKNVMGGACSTYGEYENSINIVSWKA